MPRQRFDGKRVCRVEIQVFFKTVGIKEIIANPSRRKRGNLPWIKIQLQPFPGSKNDETIIRVSQQVEHIAVARVIPRGSRVRTSHASLRIRIDRVTCRLQPYLARIADEIERRFGERDL